MVLKKIVPIILCGGSGTRLWPLSRVSYPKQFLSFDQKEKNSLLQKTIHRLKKIKNIDNPILICNEEHRFIVAEQMREINVKPQSIILEPFGKNTAPAITIAALKSLEKGVDQNLLILSADHYIEKETKFVEAIYKALKFSDNGKLVTFGIIPRSAHTGFGYIKSEFPLIQDNKNGQKIEAFFEKPNLLKANEYFKDKCFSWNSGIFLFRAEVILNELEKFNPEIIRTCKKSLNDNLYDLDFQRLNKEKFQNCPSVSIDIAIMEKTKKGIVLPLDVGWEDIGSWNSIWEIMDKDINGNVIEGDVQIINTKNSLLKSSSRLIAAIGITNTLIIETSDAILVANKDMSQEVKTMVKNLQDQGIIQGKENKKSFRPWGNYESLLNDITWQVKLICVRPKQSLSLQRHNYRSEHWVVLSGKAKVEIDRKEFFLKKNESTYIPLGSIHRLSNPINTDLKIIEIQCGSYLGEDDIERFEDNYGRDIYDK